MHYKSEWSITLGYKIRMWVRKDIFFKKSTFISEWSQSIFFLKWLEEQVKSQHELPRPISEGSEVASQRRLLLRRNVALMPIPELPSWKMEVESLFIVF